MRNRLKKLVAYAKCNGIADSQRELGNKLGYTSEQYISRLFAGNNADYTDFADKVKELIPEISKLWLLTGVGGMVEGQPNGDNNTHIHGNSNSVNNVSDVSLIKEIAAQREMFTALLQQKDEQINKLISILSK